MATTISCEYGDDARGVNVLDGGDYYIYCSSDWGGAAEHAHIFTCPSETTVDIGGSSPAGYFARCDDVEWVLGGGGEDPPPGGGEELPEGFDAAIGAWFFGFGFTVYLAFWALGKTISLIFRAIGAR